MRLIGLVAALAAVSMAATPVLAASANRAASLSLAGGKQGTAGGTSPAKASGKSRSSTILLIGVAAAAVVGGAVALGSNHHHDNKPASA